MAGTVHPVVSFGEKRFIEDGILEGVREDGRSLLEFRFHRVRCGLVQSANGSARVQVLQGGSDVLAIVKAELTAPNPAAPLQGNIGVGVQYWASAVREYGGKPAMEAAAQIESSVEQLISTPGCVNLAGLCVLPGRYAWKIWVDIVILGIGGSLVDTCGLAAFAALNDTSLPRLRVVPVEPIDDGKPLAASSALDAMLEELDAAAAGANPGGDLSAVPGSGAAAFTTGDDADSDLEPRMDYDVELEGDVSDGVPLAEAAGVDKAPIPLTLCRVGGRWVADVSAHEEAIASARVLVGLQADGKVARVETLAPLQGCSTTAGSALETAGGGSGGTNWQGVMSTTEIADVTATASAASSSVFRSVHKALEEARAGTGDAAGDAELTTFGMRLPTEAQAGLFAGAPPAGPASGAGSGGTAPMSVEEIERRLDQTAMKG